MKYFLSQCLFFVCISFLSCAEKKVFSASYDVYWKGWHCGEMRSILMQTEEGVYRYSQNLEANLWFYSFSHKEESVFLKNINIVPLSYLSEKKGIETGTYKIDFLKEHALVSRPADQKNFVEYKKTDQIHDKLTSQLAMILQMNKAPQEGAQHIDFVDYKGWHTKTYHFYKKNEQWCFHWEDGNRKNLFILDPNFNYLPIFFEQHRYGHLFFSGELREYDIGEAWDAFSS